MLGGGLPPSVHRAMVVLTETAAAVHRSPLVPIRATEVQTYNTLLWQGKHGKSNASSSFRDSNHTPPTSFACCCRDCRRESDGHARKRGATAINGARWSWIYDVNLVPQLHVMLCVVRVWCRRSRHGLPASLKNKNISSRNEGVLKYCVPIKLTVTFCFARDLQYTRSQVAGQQFDSLFFCLFHT